VASRNGANCIALRNETWVADALSVMSASNGSAISPISDPKNDAVEAAQIQRKFWFA